VFVNLDLKKLMAMVKIHQKLLLMVFEILLICY